MILLIIQILLTITAVIWLVVAIGSFIESYKLCKTTDRIFEAESERSDHNLWRKVTIDEESFKSLCIHLLLVRKQNKFGDYLREGYLLGNIQHSFTSEHTYEFIGTNGGLEAYFEIGDEIEVIFVDELSAWKQ